MKKFCRKSGKVKFATQQLAQKRAKEIMRAKHDDELLAMTEYRCRHCNHFHLTSTKRTPEQLAKLTNEKLNNSHPSQRRLRRNLQP